MIPRTIADHAALFILVRKGPEAIFLEIDISTGLFTGYERTSRLSGTICGVAADSQAQGLYLTTLFPSNITFVNLLTQDAPIHNSLNISFSSSTGITRNLWNLAVSEREGFLLAIAPAANGAATSILQIESSGPVRVVAVDQRSAVRGLSAADRLTSRYFFVLLSSSGRSLATYSADLYAPGLYVSDPSPHLNESLVGMHYDDGLQDLVLIYLRTPDTLVLCAGGVPSAGSESPQLAAALTELAALALPAWPRPRPRDLLGATRYARTRSGALLAVLHPAGGALTVFNLSSGRTVQSQMGGQPAADLALIRVNRPSLSGGTLPAGMSGSGPLLLNGSGFGLRAGAAPAFGIVVGRTACARVDWVSDSAVRALPPRAGRPGELAAVRVNVSGSLGAAAGGPQPAGPTVQYAPSWTTVTPSHGLPQGGGVLTVTGWRFDVRAPARYRCQLSVADFLLGSTNATVVSEAAVLCAAPQVDGLAALAAASNGGYVTAQLELVDGETGAAVLRDGEAGRYVVVLDLAPRLEIARRPGAVRAGGAMRPPIEIRLVDACGAPVPACGPAAPVTVDAAGSGVRLRGGTQALLQGVASFGDLQALDAGLHDLVFTLDSGSAAKCLTAVAAASCNYAANLTGGPPLSVLLEGLRVVPGSAVGLSVSGQSRWALAGLKLDPPPAVRAVDSVGNTVVDFVGAVAIRVVPQEPGFRGRTTRMLVQVITSESPAHLL